MGGGGGATRATELLLVMDDGTDMFLLPPTSVPQPPPRWSRGDRGFLPFTTQLWLTQDCVDGQLEKLVGHICTIDVYVSLFYCCCC